MVAPIYGPFQIEIGGSGPDNQSYYSLARRYKQKRPYTVAAPYARHIGKVSMRVGSPPSGARAYATQDVINFVSWSDVQNRSYEKLKSRISDRSALAVTLVEGRQSLAMIASRATQLAAFTKRLSRGDLNGAARVLKMSAVPKRASVKKSVASNWLEYYFGWVPLIGDIGDTVNVLQSPLKDQYVTASATSSGGNAIDLQAPQDLLRPSAFNDWCVWKSYERVQYEKLVSRQGVKVAVSNPNLWLANQLGFVNPATIAWELIPFSFVVDWFANVEQFLSQGTDFLGLTIQDSWNTRYLTLNYHYFRYIKYRWWVTGTYVPDDRYTYTDETDELINKGYHVVRSQGLANPVLTLKPLKLPNWKRAATAVSLLVQQLSRF